MDVRGPIPFHASVQAARAYGIPQAARPAAAAPAAAPVSATPVTATPAPAVRADRLVAGRVSVSADPSQAPAAKPAAGTFAMYTRAADRIEIATSVALGQSIDRTA